MNSHLDTLKAEWETVLDGREVAKRIQALGRFFSFCDEILVSGEDEAQFAVFFFLSQDHRDLIRFRCCFWEWLEAKVRVADYRTKRRLTEAFLTLVPDEPIRWSDLYALWNLWFDEETRWAVYAAYELFPRRIKGHAKRYCAHRNRHQLPVLEFKFDDFRAWLISWEAEIKRNAQQNVGDNPIYAPGEER